MAPGCQRAPRDVVPRAEQGGTAHLGYITNDAVVTEWAAAAERGKELGRSMIESR